MNGYSKCMAHYIHVRISIYTMHIHYRLSRGTTMSARSSYTCAPWSKKWATATVRIYYYIYYHNTLVLCICAV